MYISLITITDGQHVSDINIQALEAKNTAMGNNLNISKTKRNTGLVSIEDVQVIVYSESNGHVTDDVTRPYNVTVCL